MGRRNIRGAGVGVIYTGTRELLATDLIILNHGQMTRKTPQLACPSPKICTTPTGGRLNHDIFSVHPLTLLGGSSTVRGSNSAVPKLF
ncbi:hypothetical protein TNCV_3691721 [Trichonephila clavipes]|nr:hypothetical protein TNCV_3691721 [Trichonephila clavipes]